MAGTSLPKVNGREMVTGAHKYTYDMKRPGMLYGKVLYPPQFGAHAGFAGQLRRRRRCRA